jgi:hypothetical protein
MILLGLRQEHDIGQDFAIYYIAYAAYLELRGSYAKAEAVFKAGLERYYRFFTSPVAVAAGVAS